MPVVPVIDHLGWPDLGLGVTEPGFQALCELLKEGQVWVKLSGAYRVCDAPYSVADNHVASLLAANPQRCLWGTDWPHLMLADAKMPDAGVLLNRFLDVATENETKTVLVRNPESLYGFSQVS